jgi:2-phosphoglycerate kinase
VWQKHFVNIHCTQVALSTKLGWFCTYLTCIVIIFRLGIDTIICTDTIRKELRSHVSEQENPVLWASSYDAGVALQKYQQQQKHDGELAQSDINIEDNVIHGYELQNEFLFQHLQKHLQTSSESVIMEGVHLSVATIHRLIQHQQQQQQQSSTTSLSTMPTTGWLNAIIVPFIVHISDQVAPAKQSQ